MSGLFLILTRIRIRGRRRPVPVPGDLAPHADLARLIAQDAEQALLLALAITLLETGSWWGLLLVVADLGWLVYSFFFAPNPRSDPGKP